jgi:alkylation response protein AidB-like acyl-CoA dehydrogenase
LAHDGFQISDELLDALTAEFASRAAEHDRDASFPFENIARLQELGLLALTVPATLGGGEASLATARRVIRAVARGEPSTALVLVMQYQFQRTVAHDPEWPAELRRRIGQEAVEQGALLNALSVEPELGTPQRGGLPATIGRRTDEGWRVSGRKLYSTGIPALTWLAVVGRTDEPEPRLGLFVIGRDAPGIRVVETWNHLGMRATGSHEVVFDDVPVAAENLVPFQRLAERTGPRQVVQQAWGLVLLSSLYDGIAQAARDWLVGFLNARQPSNLGAALATLPRFQEAVGTIDSLLFTNQLMLDAVAEKIDHGRPLAANEGALLKYVVTKNAIDAVAKALELTGNPGLSRDNPLERHYRDVLCSRIHTPQNDVILTAAGRLAFEAA